jgi:predicted nucleotide-binding protein (sugar kinase/HSP70/actin superfamily)
VRGIGLTNGFCCGLNITDMAKNILKNRNRFITPSLDHKTPAVAIATEVAVMDLFLFLR